MADDKSITRQCSKCGQAYDGKMFSKSSKGLYGLSSQCKNCDREYRQANKERIKATQKRYMETNKEKVQALKKAHWAKNRPLLLQKLRVRNHLYRERRIKKQREDYAANRQAVISRVREYQKTHPEVDRLCYHNRKARHLSAAGQCSREQWIAKCFLWGWRCYLCSASLTPQTVQVEHRIPLAKGGTNWPANLAPACGRCNMSKHDITETEFRRTRSFANFSLSALTAGGAAA